MEIRDGIYAAGQPTSEGIRRLEELGIKTIVNLRPIEESGARDESAEAAKFRMNYTSIGLTANTITDQKMREFANLIGDKTKYPLFVHCSSGNRAAGMWFLYRVLYETASVPEAMAEAEMLGLKDELKPKLMEFLERAQQ
jgi:uncharacterized protein (TIGR01244 family)